MEHLIDSPLFAVLLVAYLLFGVGRYATAIVEFHERGMERLRRAQLKKEVNQAIRAGFDAAPRRATTWPYTTPTGVTYTEPLDFAQTHEYCTTVAQAYLEGWELDEWPPTPTNTMLTAVVHFTDKLIDEYANSVLMGDAPTLQALAAKRHTRQEDTASGAPRSFTTGDRVRFADGEPTGWRPGRVSNVLPVRADGTRTYEVVAGDNGAIVRTHRVIAYT